MGRAIGLDGSGNVYVAGTFTGTNQIGTNRLVRAGSNDVFIAKLNPDSAVVWSVSTRGLGDDSIRSLVVTTNGALFVSGHFSIRPSLLGPATNISPVVSNVFLACDQSSFREKLLPEWSGSEGMLRKKMGLWLSRRNYRNSKHGLKPARNYLASTMGLLLDSAQRILNALPGG